MEAVEGNSGQMNPYALVTDRTKFNRIRARMEVATLWISHDCTRAGHCASACERGFANRRARVLMTASAMVWRVGKSYCDAASRDAVADELDRCASTCNRVRHAVYWVFGDGVRGPFDGKLSRQRGRRCDPAAGRRAIRGATGSAGRTGGDHSRRGLDRVTHRISRFGPDDLQDARHRPRVLSSERPIPLDHSSGGVRPRAAAGDRPCLPRLAAAGNGATGLGGWAAVVRRVRRRVLAAADRGLGVAFAFERTGRTVRQPGRCSPRTVSSFGAPNGAAACGRSPGDHGDFAGKAGMVGTPGAGHAAASSGRRTELAPRGLGYGAGGEPEPPRLRSENVAQPGAARRRRSAVRSGFLDCPMDSAVARQPVYGEVAPRARGGLAGAARWELPHAGRVPVSMRL